MARSILKVPIGTPPEIGNPDKRKVMKVTNNDERNRVIKFMRESGAYFKDREHFNQIVRPALQRSMSLQMSRSPLDILRTITAHSF